LVVRSGIHKQSPVSQTGYGASIIEYIVN
jgi:hypothetical protein